MVVHFHSVQVIGIALESHKKTSKGDIRSSEIQQKNKASLSKLTVKSLSITPCNMEVLMRVVLFYNFTVLRITVYMGKWVIFVWNSKKNPQISDIYTLDG